MRVIDLLDNHAIIKYTFSKPIEDNGFIGNVAGLAIEVVPPKDTTRIVEEHFIASVCSSLMLSGSTTH